MPASPAGLQLKAPNEDPASYRRSLRHLEMRAFPRWAGGNSWNLGVGCACRTQNSKVDMAVGQNQWYHFEVGAPLILVYVSGIGIFTGGTIWLLTHGHMTGQEGKAELSAHLNDPMGATDFILSCSVAPFFLFCWGLPHAKWSFQTRVPFCSGSLND